MTAQAEHLRKKMAEDDSSGRRRKYETETMEMATKRRQTWQMNSKILNWKLRQPRH